MLKPLKTVQSVAENQLIGAFQLNEHQTQRAAGKPAGGHGVGKSPFDAGIGHGGNRTHGRWLCRQHSDPRCASARHGFVTCPADHPGG